MVYGCEKGLTSAQLQLVAEARLNEERTHGYSLLDGLRGSVLEALHPVDGPEVRGKRRVADVLVGHVEVALVTPPHRGN